ncbi:MAG: hypothetical protein P8079_05075 [Gammaproteobacteria bacterium]
MFNDNRAHVRLSVPKYYTGGSFHLIDGERKYHYIRANDVCVAGVGLDVPSAIERGSQVKICFTSRNWRADLEGIVMWCERSDRIGVSKQSYQNYRVGIQLDPENAEENSLLYLTLRDGLDQAGSEHPAQ